MSAMNLCIIGCGAIARRHAKMLIRRRSDVELYVASRFIEKASAFARSYGAKGFFGTYKEAMEDPKIHAVLICTPNDQHYSQTLHALRAGKDVIVEKPMAITSAQANEMNRTAKAAGRKLLVGENHRFRPSVRAVEKIIANGDLGTLKMIRMNIMTSRKLSANEWRSQPGQMGGGPLIDGGIHWVNVLLTYGGGSAVQLTAKIPPRTQPNYPGEDTIAILAECQNGASATLTYSWGIRGTPTLKFYSLHGSEGSLYVSNHGFFGWMSGKRRSFKIFPLVDWQGFDSMWNHFIDVLKNDAPCRMGGLEGLRDVAFVEKAYESAKRGESISLSVRRV